MRRAMVVPAKSRRHSLKSPQQRAASSGCVEKGPTSLGEKQRSVSQQNVNAAPCLEERPPAPEPTKIVFDYTPGPDPVSSVLRKRVVPRTKSNGCDSHGAPRAQADANTRPVKTDPCAAQTDRPPQTLADIRPDEHRGKNAGAPRQPMTRCPQEEPPRGCSGGKTVKTRAASTSECKFPVATFPAFKEISPKKDKRDCKVTFGDELAVANAIYNPGATPQCPSAESKRPANFKQPKVNRLRQVSKTSFPGQHSDEMLPEFPSQIEIAQPTFSSSNKPESSQAMKRPTVDNDPQQQQPAKDKRSGAELICQVKCLERVSERKQEGGSECGVQRCAESARPKKSQCDHDGRSAGSRQKKDETVQIYRPEVEVCVEVEVEQDSYSWNPESKQKQAYRSSEGPKNRQSLSSGTADAWTQTELGRRASDGLGQIPGRKLSTEGQVQQLARRDSDSKADQPGDRRSSGPWKPQEIAAGESEIQEGCKEALQQDAERRRRQEASERITEAALQSALGRRASATGAKATGGRATGASTTGARATGASGTGANRGGQGPSQSGRQSAAKTTGAAPLYDTAESEQQPICPVDSPDNQLIYESCLKVAKPVRMGAAIRKNGLDIYGETGGDAELDKEDLDEEAGDEQPSPSGEPNSTGTEDGDPVIKPNKKCCR